MNLSTDYYEILINDELRKYWMVLPLIENPIAQKGSRLLKFQYNGFIYYVDLGYVVEEDFKVGSSDLLFDIEAGIFVLLKHSFICSNSDCKLSSIYKSGVIGLLKSKFKFVLKITLLIGYYYHSTRSLEVLYLKTALYFLIMGFG